RASRAGRPPRRHTPVRAGAGACAKLRAMIDLGIARALHVLAVVHWIGGVFLVTASLLPAVIRETEPARRMALFEAVEARFSRQAKLSVLLVGATGFYMTHRLHAWGRFLDAAFWWMHAMVLVWVLFALVL